SAARQAGITDYATLVFESKGRKRNITGLDESALTSAIVNVTRGDQKVIYFLTGHGERGMDATSQDGYSQAKQSLEKDNYVIKSAALAVTPTVPADCALLIVAGPTKPLLSAEITAINTSLDRGGKLLFLTDPQVSTGLEDGVLKRLGIVVRNDVVIDPASSLLGDVASPEVSNFGWSPITKDLRASAVFPLARSLTTDQTPPAGVTVVEFARTGVSSWGETDLTNTAQLSFDPAKDVKGPLTLGLSAEVAHAAGGVTIAPTARLVVYGDSDFASNALASALGNLDLFANSVNWLAEDESLISIRAKPPTERMLSMTSSEQILALISSLVLLPLAVLLVGALVWWRRR
ncbi:MAG: Gldg family protein, partial [Chloroflexota bacterium]|nr:Gldg family protein [Chloroflexota bacterium]